MKGAVIAIALLAGLLLRQQPAVTLAQAPAGLLTADATSRPFLADITDPASLLKNADTHLVHAEALLDQLVAATGRRTIVNTLQRYDDILIEVSLAQGGANVLDRQHPDAAFRDVARKVLDQVGAFQTALSLNPAVYRALSEIDLTGADAETRHYVTRELTAMRLVGGDRDEKTRARLQALRQQLSAAMAEFNDNVRNGTRTIEAPTSALDGLPPDVIARLPAAAGGLVTLRTADADARPVLTYARNDDLRKAMYVALNTVGYPANHAVLRRMLDLRGEIATLAGFANWAEYDMAPRMARTASAASSFIDRVADASRARMTREYEMLLARKRQDVPGATDITAWESNYYSELVRRASYDFDSQQLRPYLSMTRVKPGLLDVAARLFSVTYRRVDGVPVWHPSVEAYELIENGQAVGRFYFDLHPRPGKAGNSPATTVIRRGVGKRQLPEVALIASLPGAKPGDPGLMAHDDVRIFFHEFGHLVHNVLGGHRRWFGTGGTPSERDFSEAQSQMLEEWTMDAATLATFAHHHESGAPVPAALVAQLRRASDFGQALGVRSQMAYAKLSLSLHDRPPAKVDPDALLRDALSRYTPYRYPQDTHFEARFTQLANVNYSASYYTYMWSLVIAKDLFAQFDGNNLLAPGVARRYRETMLVPGGSKPAATLLQDFLGRAFSPKAWEAWLNGGN